MQPTIKFERPQLDDGKKMWSLAKTTSLDLNSSYKYLMMAQFFSDTCLVAKVDEQVVGFVTAYVQPSSPDTLFIWQVGVSDSQRGKGIASRMLNTLLKRHIEDKIRFVEATITPDNGASIALFKKLQKEYSTELEVKSCFPSEAFPEEGEHEREDLYRVGPLK